MCLEVRLLTVATSCALATIAAGPASVSAHPASLARRKFASQTNKRELIVNLFMTRMGKSLLQAHATYKRNKKVLFDAKNIWKIGIFIIWKTTFTQIEFKQQLKESMLIYVLN